MQPRRYKIKSLVYERVNEDGTTEDVFLEDTDAYGMGMGYFLPLSAAPGKEDEEQKFWIASSHDGITSGTNVIASGVPGADKSQEWHKDRTNTMIGLIRDNACTAYCIYSPDPFAQVK